MMNKRMWLQSDENEPTWCEDKLNDDDVEYVRADINAALLEALEYIENTLCDTSRNDFKNVNNALVRAGDAIRKAKEK